MKKAQPILSIISRHEPENLDHLVVLIDSLYAQEIESWEHIIVVDAHEQDATDTNVLIESLDDKRFKLAFTGGKLENASFDPEILGISVASGDYLCFVPDTWYLADDYIQEHISIIKEDSDAVGSVCMAIGNESNQLLPTFTDTNGLLLLLADNHEHLSQCFFKLCPDIDRSKKIILALLQQKTSVNYLFCKLQENKPLVFNSTQEGRELFDDVMGV